MSSRCASCRYPLSISDSVKCRECDSYFHIDCAQLVGFTHFELSDDPNKNTFHCRTCELLPLPTARCDSDSDSESGMPSRQLDYMEAPADIAKDMNEIKGSVQDLSNLCKDMFREVNEIKSINLTLRCCIENLRHENEERDVVIEGLKRRLEALEGSSKTSVNQTLSQVGCANEGLGLDVSIDEKQCSSLEDKPDELCSNRELPINCEEPEETLLKNISRVKRNPNDSLEYLEENKTFQSLSDTYDSEANILEPKEVKENRHDWTWRNKTAVEVDNEGEQSFSEEGETDESELGDDVQDWKTLNEEIESVSKQNIEEEYKSKCDLSTLSSKGGEGTLSDAEEEVKTQLGVAENLESCSKACANEDEKKAETKRYKADDMCDEETDAETESVQTLKEFGELKEETEKQQELSEDDLEALTSEEVSDLLRDESYESTIKEKRECTTGAQQRLTDTKFSTEDDEESSEESEDRITERETNHLGDKNLDEDFEDESESEAEEIRHEDFIEVEVGEIPEERENEESAFTEETDEHLVEETELAEEEGDHLAKSEGVHQEDGETCLEGGEACLEGGETCPEEGETCLEGVESLEGEPRLLEEEPRLEGEECPEGEQRLEEEPRPLLDGETGLEVEGEERLGGQSQLDEEVQPTEPSQTPPPNHTEEDLWEYLREAVSSEHHPTTVEEFLQNLIGTLKHVPEDLLQPVVEANIKRAGSPSSADGDPARTVDELPMEQQESAGLEVVPSRGADGAPAPEASSSVLEGTSEIPSEFAVEDNEGLSPVEAAA